MGAWAGIGAWAGMVEDYACDNSRGCKMGIIMFRRAHS
jgi:hypothetical protein